MTVVSVEAFLENVNAIDLRRTQKIIEINLAMSRCCGAVALACDGGLIDVEFGPLDDLSEAIAELMDERRGRVRSLFPVIKPSNEQLTQHRETIGTLLDESLLETLGRVARQDAPNDP